MERNRLLRSASEDNPSVSILTEEAETYYNSIKASLQSSKQQLTIRRNQLQAQKEKYASKISSAPSKERALADINRQQEVKAGLYLMLLQKREENAITLASSAYKGKVIEEPIVSGPVSPKKKMIFLVALIVGIVLPYAYYFIRNFFRFRVENREDIYRLTKVPLLGSVPFIKALDKGDRNVVVQENRNSVVVEVYRSIRSNLPFVLSKDQNVILFTSTTSGEGKTCVASNLAASIAFAGKKVVIVGLDIRKPRLAGLFNLASSDKGISNFFTRPADDYQYLESIIQKSDISPNLDIIAAGPIPPNPAELLEKENLETAINYLKKKYDYVLLDTAPIGLVSDTLSVGKVADATLFVVRANYTLKADLELVNSLAAENRLPNVNIILNAAKVESNSYTYKKYGYGYGYGYGRRYGYGYGSYGGYGYGYGEKEGGKKLEEI
jgi:capsular exopolysaccharide synthesis family protein